MSINCAILLVFLLAADANAFSWNKVGCFTRSSTGCTPFSLDATIPRVDEKYFSDPMVNPSLVNDYNISGDAGSRITLTRYLNDMVIKAGSDDLQSIRDLESIILSIQMACKTISNLVNRAGISNSSPNALSAGAISRSSLQDDPRSNSQIRLDLISTTVLQNALRFTGKLRMITPVNLLTGNEAGEDESEDDVEKCKRIESVTDDKPSEHQPGVIIASGLDDSKYVACLDPLDGSGNADAGICTATIFGIFENDENQPTDEIELQKSVLQPGKNLRAAGYCLYSSATILIFSIGDGVHGFTLDSQLGEFVLTHPNVRIPKLGNIYSCNEANSEGWTDSLKNYLKALKTGKNKSGEKYTSRYVGSMVGDIHRTLMYGGVFLYPSDTDTHPNGNLQLLYKSIPLGYLVEQAGGKSLTSKRQPLLSVRPKKIHERAPCFFGSPDNIKELKNFL